MGFKSFFTRKFAKRSSEKNLKFSYQTKEKNSDDYWRGSRFLVISLVVTASSIIFFFAERHLFSKMDEATTAPWPKKMVQAVAHGVIEWGGVKLKGIELEIFPVRAEGDPFAKFASDIRERLSIYYGQPFWLLDLEKVKAEILNEGWVKSVAIRRSFLGAATGLSNGSLKIKIFSREPAFLVHGARSWIVIDSEGNFISRANQIPGDWATLPLIYGLEEPYSRERSPIELNRELSKEREFVSDLSQLILALKDQVKIDVDSVTLQKDNWSSEAQYHLKFKNSEQKEVEAIFLSHHWNARLQSFQFILSDLQQKKITPTKILGQYDDRWFIRKEEPLVSEVKKIIKAAPAIKQASNSKATSKKGRAKMQKKHPVKKDLKKHG